MTVKENNRTFKGSEHSEQNQTRAEYRSEGRPRILILLDWIYDCCFPLEHDACLPNERKRVFNSPRAVDEACLLSSNSRTRTTLSPPTSTINNHAILRALQAFLHGPGIRAAPAHFEAAFLLRVSRRGFRDLAGVEGPPRVEFRAPLLPALR